MPSPAHLIWSNFVANGNTLTQSNLLGIMGNLKALEWVRLPTFLHPDWRRTKMEIAASKGN